MSLPASEARKPVSHPGPVVPSPPPPFQALSGGEQKNSRTLAGSEQSRKANNAAPASFFPWPANFRASQVSIPRTVSPFISEKGSHGHDRQDLRDLGTASEDSARRAPRRSGRREAGRIPCPGRFLMKTRLIRCGSSQALYQAPYQTLPTAQPVRPDKEPVRLRSPVHVASRRSDILNYRVVARLADGRGALVCLGATPEDAAAKARVNAPPESTVQLYLQQWVGGTWSGSWQSIRWRGKEVPLLPVRRVNRRPWRKRQAG
jgi:hypothetical protein